jgi:hypothetical protein
MMTKFCFREAVMEKIIENGFAYCCHINGDCVRGCDGVCIEEVEVEEDYHSELSYSRHIEGN